MITDEKMEEMRQRILRIKRIIEEQRIEIERLQASIENA